MSGLFDKAHRPILLIMAAVFTWGSLHALGAYLLEHDYRKPLVVYGCLLVFLGLWAAMLASRNRRLAREQWHDLDSHRNEFGTNLEDSDSAETRR